MIELTNRKDFPIRIIEHGLLNDEEDLYLIKLAIASAIVRKELCPTMSSTLKKYGYSEEDETLLFKKIAMDIAEKLL